MSLTLLKEKAEERKVKTIEPLIAKLLKIRIEATKNEDGTYTVKSLATGGVFQRNATEKELNQYLTASSYIVKKHGGEFGVKYTKPVQYYGRK